MQIIKFKKKWWIVRTPPYKDETMWYTVYGPYDKREEAVSDRRGVRRFLKQVQTHE